ncbi:hypothetical protein G9A89_000377, partial [Geosiphon pyriformis]
CFTSGFVQCVYHGDRQQTTWYQVGEATGLVSLPQESKYLLYKQIQPFVRGPLYPPLCLARAKMEYLGEASPPLVTAYFATRLLQGSAYSKNLYPSPLCWSRHQAQYIEVHYHGNLGIIVGNPHLPTNIIVSCAKQWPPICHPWRYGIPPGLLRQSVLQGARDNDASPPPPPHPTGLDSLPFEIVEVFGTVYGLHMRGMGEVVDIAYTWKAWHLLCAKGWVLYIGLRCCPPPYRQVSTRVVDVFCGYGIAYEDGLLDDPFFCEEAVEHSQQ